MIYDSQSVLIRYVSFSIVSKFAFSIIKAFVDSASLCYGFWILVDIWNFLIIFWYFSLSPPLYTLLFLLSLSYLWFLLLYLYVFFSWWIRWLFCSISLNATLRKINLYPWDEAQSSSSSWNPFDQTISRYSFNRFEFSNFRHRWEGLYSRRSFPPSKRVYSVTSSDPRDYHVSVLRDPLVSRSKQGKSLSLSHTLCLCLSPSLSFFSVKNVFFPRSFSYLLFLFRYLGENERSWFRFEDLVWKRLYIQEAFHTFSRGFDSASDQCPNDYSGCYVYGSLCFF